MDWVVAAISAIRAIRTEVNVPAGGARCRCWSRMPTPPRWQRLERHREHIQRLARVERIEHGRDGAGGRGRRGRRGHDADPARRRRDRSRRRRRRGSAKEIGRLDADLAKIRRRSSATRPFSPRPSPKWSRSSASARPTRAATATGCKPSTTASRPGEAADGSTGAGRCLSSLLRLRAGFTHEIAPLIAAEHVTTMAQSDRRSCTMVIRALRLAVVVAAIGVACAHAQAPSADIAPFAPFVPPWPTNLSPVTIVPPPGDGFGAFDPGGGLWIAELQYPSMQPYRKLACRPARCEDEVDLYLSAREGRRCTATFGTSDASLLARLHPDVRGETYATLPAPEGYTEAWEERVSRPPAGSYPLRTSIYIRADASGKPSEYVRCTAQQKVESDQKLCVVQTELERAPSLQIEYAFPSSQWPNHRTIRAAIIGMVDSWRR